MNLNRARDVPLGTNIHRPPPTTSTWPTKDGIFGWQFFPRDLARLSIATPHRKPPLRKTPLRELARDGDRNGDDGVKRRKGASVHAARRIPQVVRLALADDADDLDRVQVGDLAVVVLEVAGETVELGGRRPGWDGCRRPTPIHILAEHKRTP